METLRKRSEFIAAQKSGKKIVTRTIVVEAAENKHDIIRVGYTVSKKVSKLAVTRNKIKRRLRAAAREILPELGVKGKDYVLVGRHNAFVNDFAVIVEDLKYAVKKIGKMNEEG